MNLDKEQARVATKHRSFKLNDVSKKEINLRDIYVVIKNKLWVLLLSIIVFGSVGGLYIAQPVTPLYEMSTRLYIQANTDLFNTLKVIIREPIVLDEVIKILELNRSAEGLRGQIQVSNVEGSTILKVSVIDRDPHLAVNIANTIVSAYKRVAADTVFFTNIVVLTEAELRGNPVPINPKSFQPLFFSLIFGIILGIGMIFLIDSMDDTIKNERDIELFSGLSMLGYVSNIKRKNIAKKNSKQRNLALRSETIGS